MIFEKKSIPILMAYVLASMVVGCDKNGSEQANNTFRGYHPVQVVLDAMGDSFQDSVTHLDVTQRVNSGESPDNVVVTVVESGLLDDSVAAKKNVFSMSYKEGKWEIIDRVETQRCWPNRGHQDFSGKPCQ